MAKLIVWIEDDIDLLEPVIRPLERAGYDFIKIRSAGEALTTEAIEQIRNADLMLLDLLIPDWSSGDDNLVHYQGIKLLLTLRKTYGVTTPVIIFSVITIENSYLDSKELNVIAVLRKPIRPSELKLRIEEQLDNIARPNWTE